MAEIDLPSDQEEVRRRLVGTESTPGGVGSPLGSETLETQPLPALDALLQTNFDELQLPPVRGGTKPHAYQHMAHGDDEVHSFDTISVYDFIIMRKGHEDDAGVVLQDEIPVASITRTHMLETGSALYEIPLVRLESEETPINEDRIQVNLQPRQGTPAGGGFLELKTNQVGDAAHVRAGIGALVQGAVSTTGKLFLYTEAASAHDATPHLHTLTLNPWAHILEFTGLGTGDDGFRIASVKDPTDAQDVATKNYVDALTYTDADAIAAIEGEATLALSGAVEITGILTVDVINEKTGDAGVTIEATLLKDSLIDGVALAEQSAAYNGTFVEPMTFVVTSNGSTITGTLDKDPTGDLTEVFSDGYTIMSSGATVVLTAGGADSPQKNYVYVLQSDKGVLVISTSDWPSAEHIKVAEVVVQTAALVQSNGILANRYWNDFRAGTDGQGHHPHTWERLRWEHSAYKSGSAVTWSGSGTGVLNLAITAGKAYQMHLQSVSAFDTTDPDSVYVVNHPTAYTITPDIETLVVDSDNDSLSNKYYNLVIWQSVSSGSEEEKVFINLPSGSYMKQSDATSDVSGYDDFNIPSDYRGYAYLVQRVTIKHSTAGGGTWTIIQQTDLRGTVPSIAVGGGTLAITTEFADNAFKLFDEGDPTKELAFQLSGITAGNVRTVTAPDKDLTLIDAADAIAAVEGEATLVLTGEVSIASGKSLSLLTDGSTGGLKLGASSDVILYRGAANRFDLGTGDDFRLVSGDIELVTGKALKIFNAFGDANPLAQLSWFGLDFGPGGASPLDMGIGPATIFSTRVLMANTGSTGMNAGDSEFSDFLAPDSILSRLVLRLFSVSSGGGKDANARAHYAHDRLEFGAGGASALDVNLYRNAADELKTDDKFIIGAGLEVTGNSNFGAYYLDIDDIAVPSNPGAGIRRLFVDTATGELSVRTNAGTTVSLEGALTGHDHTGAGDGGVLTDDKHDGFSEYDEISAPSTPAANKLRLYVKDFSALSALFYKDDAGHEIQVSDKLWTNFPIYGPVADAQWRQESTTGTSILVVKINGLDLRPNAGHVVTLADNNTWAPYPGDAANVIDWSRRVVFKFRFSLANASSTTINLFQLGRNIAPGFTNPNNRCIAIRLDNLVLIGQVHDGSGLTQTGTLANLSIGIAYEMLIVSRGDGTVEWFLNGSSVGTSGGGPSSAGVAGQTVPMFAARDTASTNGRMFINQCDVLVL